MARVWPRTRALQHAHDATVIAELMTSAANAIRAQVGDDPVLRQRLNGLRETRKRAAAYGRYGYYAARYAEIVARYRPGTAPPDMVRAAERNAANFSNQFPPGDARYPAGTVELIAANINSLGIDLPRPGRYLLAMEQHSKVADSGSRDRPGVSEELLTSAAIAAPTVSEALLAALQSRDPSLDGRPPEIAVLESVAQGLPLGVDLGAAASLGKAGRAMPSPGRATERPPNVSPDARMPPGTEPGRGTGPQRAGRPGQAPDPGLERGQERSR